MRHGRYVTFQMAEVAVPRNPFREILRRIYGLRRSSPVLCHVSTACSAAENNPASILISSFPITSPPPTPGMGRPPTSSVADHLSSTLVRSVPVHQLSGIGEHPIAGRFPRACFGARARHHRSGPAARSRRGHTHPETRCRRQVAEVPL